MKKNILHINYDRFKNTKFYKAVFSMLFLEKNVSFGDRIDDSTKMAYFGTTSPSAIDHRMIETIIEDVFIDLDEGKIKIAIISFELGYTDPGYGYALLLRSRTKNRYNIVFLNRYKEKLNVEESKKESISTSLSNILISNLLEKDLSYFYSKNFVSRDTERIYYAGRRLISESRIKAMQLKIADILRIDYKFIDINCVVFDLNSFENPEISYIEFVNKDTNKIYDFYLGTKSIEEKHDPENCDENPSYLTVICEKALASFDIAPEVLDKMEYLDNSKKMFLSLLKKKFKTYTILNDNDNGYGFEEAGKRCFIKLTDYGIVIKKNQIDDSDEELFEYEKIEDFESIRNAINCYLKSESYEYINFKNKSKEYLGETYNINTSKEKYDELLSIYNFLSVSEKRQVEKLGTKAKIDSKNEKILNFNKELVTKALKIIEKINDAASYDKHIDELTDLIDSFEEGESSAIKEKYDHFLNSFLHFSNYNFDQTVYRKVYIRKKVLAQLKKINDENPSFDILDATDLLVDNLKTLKGNELGKFLLSKGLNFPIKEDRSIKKIRIKKTEKYRLLFVYGSDINNNDRNSNLNSIYIFGITEHKKDKSDLYEVAKSKPTEYKINDFIIYPNNKSIIIPECTSDQYKLVNNSDNKPTVTFGCAGSGKTTVSVEQYVDLVYEKYDAISPKNAELVYITFHNGLSERVKKDLKEFKIDGNCYSLIEYFSYVCDETIDKQKIINELTFVEWFEKNFSDDEIKKNKGKKRNKISPLLGKPDLARLLYTYYRGVLKGSRMLFDSNLDFLPFEVFKSEMSNETYLKDEEKKSIYEICKDFDKYCSSEGLISDNELALCVIKKEKFVKKTACIIIDEVQDLTEIELLAVLCTLKEDSKKIYYYGDPHQSINPNLFDGSTINRIYTFLGINSIPKNDPLDITYRTNRHLIKYLNKLLEDREKWIGFSQGGISRIKEPLVMDENTSWAGYVTNKDLYEKIFISNPNSMIITPSEKVREELLRRYPKIDSDRAISIYSAKGMEWDTIIMYNMFSDYEPYFNDMISLNGEAKKSTIHRMTFNKFYVACTRSTKSFVIIEENTSLFDSDNQIFKALLSSFAPINKEEQINTYILENNSFEAWYKEAFQNLSNENTNTFDHAIIHARQLAKTPEQIKLVRELISGDSAALENSAFKFLNEKEYDLARSAFTKLNKSTKKHGFFILLSVLLSGRQISDDHLKEFLKNKELIFKYPEVLPYLVKTNSFNRLMLKISSKLFS